MWLPEWLYRALPYLYAAAGMLSLIYSDHPVGKASGLLLLLTAYLVFSWRSAASKNRRRSGPRYH